MFAMSFNGPPDPPEPLLTPETPDGPWHTIHEDFYRPLITGQHIINLIDKYSRYPEAEIIKSSSAKTLIPKLDAIFARHGISHILKSDNKPLFHSEDFKRYLTKLGTKHGTSTPEWPQGNFEAGVFMKALGKKQNSRSGKSKLARYSLLNEHSSSSTPFQSTCARNNTVVKSKGPVLNRHKEAKTKKRCKSKTKKKRIR